MTLLGRDVGEIEALVTDRYLDSLLGDRDAPMPAAALDDAVRAVSRRLAGDLPRFHPSFRFEERLAVRLAEAAASMRLPLAAGGESPVARLPRSIAGPAPDPLRVLADDESRADQRPLLVGGAVAASAISLAGAAWIAWRRRGAGTAMTRAVRAAHQARAEQLLRPSTGQHG
jgi:hypothetical protein